MHLRIDGAGKDQSIRQKMAFVRRWRFPLPDQHDNTVAYRNEAILQDAIGQDNRARKHQIEISHQLISLAGRSGSGNQIRHAHSFVAYPNSWTSYAPSPDIGKVRDWISRR